MVKNCDGEEGCNRDISSCSDSNEEWLMIGSTIASPL